MRGFTVRGTLSDDFPIGWPFPISFHDSFEVFHFRDHRTVIRGSNRKFGELPKKLMRKQHALSLKDSEKQTAANYRGSTGDHLINSGMQRRLPFNGLESSLGKIDAAVTAMSFREREGFGHANSPQQMAYSYRQYSWMSQSPSSFRTALSSNGSLSKYSTPSSRLGSLRTNLPGQCLHRSLLSHQVERVRSPAEDINTDYMKILREMNLLLGPIEELNWSGKGQHVEFLPMEEIPLVPLAAIGHGGSAIVDSVLCRRIKLARKTITLSRRQKLETVIAEVEHLQRLRHPHIVQLVGSYTLGRNFSILLYPVAEFNLSTLLERMTSLSEFAVEHTGLTNAEFPSFSHLFKFQRCLSHALEYVHQNTTKHMDIKPQNILVRRIKGLRKWWVYLYV